MIFHSDILAAYELAKQYVGEDGRVATMPDVVDAKIAGDSYSPIWTRYVTTTTGEFYGKSKKGTPVVVVARDISSILADEHIIIRSTKNLRENSQIQLTAKEFQRLLEGDYGSVEILDHKTVVNMREYPTSVLSHADAMMNDLLLRARLGAKTDEFLERHLKITREESGNDYILTNEHKYLYVNEKSMYKGGLLVMSQPMDARRCGGEPSSVSSQVDISDLTSAARFIAITGKGTLAKVSDGLESALKNIAKNWKKLLVPNKGRTPSIYTLKEIDDQLFVQYREDDDVMGSGEPAFHVNRARKIGKEKLFVTEILGYYGFFKYELKDVKAIAPEDANAFLMGEPENIWEYGNPVKQKVPVQFYKVDVDTSRRILRDEEVKKDIKLVKSLVS